MRAMLLCAGLGTRLGPLSDERPKPLLPVCDVPLVRYGLALLEAAGVREVAVNLHHRGDLLRAELAPGTTGPIDVTFSEEESLLGTGGGIRRIADWLTEGGRQPFFVLNGKVAIDADLAALAAAHARSGAEGTMLLRPVDAADDRFGRVDLDARGRVVGILGESSPAEAGAPEAPVARTMFTGVHVVSPALAARLPEGPSCVVRQGYLPALREGRPIAGVRQAGYFQEHSTPARYLAGNFALLRGAALLRHAPGELRGVSDEAQIGVDVTIDGPCRVGPGAFVGDGAHLGPDVVVGRRARVLPGARLERTVVWPEAVAGGVVKDAIVTPRGVLPVDPDATDGE